METLTIGKLRLGVEYRATVGLSDNVEPLRFIGYTPSDDGDGKNIEIRFTNRSGKIFEGYIFLGWGGWFFLRPVNGKGKYRHLPYQ